MLKKCCCAPARSALGSTSGGAGSPNGLTEGVSFDEWNMLPVLRYSGVYVHLGAS